MSVFKEMQEVTVYFARGQGTKIFTEEGCFIGRLTDFFVNYKEIYPPILALQYRKGSKLCSIPWDNVIQFSYKKIIVKSNPTTQAPPPYLPLGKLILDRQVVDTHGKKVVRVNDIQFVRSETNLRVTHVCIGAKSLIRRIGNEFLLNMLSRFVNIQSDILIHWKNIHSIPNKHIQNNVQLDLRNEDIKKIHPADLADILEDIDSRGRKFIFQGLDPKTAAQTLSEVEESLSHLFIKDLPSDKIAKILIEMDTDDAADILGQMPSLEKEKVIEKIDDAKYKKAITELLKYDESTAGGLMSTKIFEISPATKRGRVLEIVKEKYENLTTIHDIYIISPEMRLLGVCPIHTLLLQSRDLEIGEFMKKEDIKSLPPQTHWKDVAHCMRKYNLVTLPVVDRNDKLLGIISVDDILDCLLED